VWDKDFSHLFDVKDAITRNNIAPIRSSQVSQLLPESKSLSRGNDDSAKHFSWSTYSSSINYQRSSCTEYTMFDSEVIFVCLSLSF